MATEIAIAVVEFEGRYLVGMRGAATVMAGYDEFPGGKVRPGERPARAAERECLEETGIEIKSLGLVLPVVEHQYDHGDVRLHFFRCRPRGDAKPLAPFRWIEANQLSALRFPEANRGVVAALLASSQ